MSTQPLPLDVTPAPVPVPAPRARASVIATHLDMAVIGELCAGIGLPGYREVLASFLADTSGSQAALLAALARADRVAVRERAHAIKGAAASLGLTAVRAICARLERDADRLPPQACAVAATELRRRLRSTRDQLQRLGFA